MALSAPLLARLVAERESVERAPREPRGLGEFAESLNRRCPGGDVGRCGGGSGFHLSGLPGGRGNGVELRECGRRRAEEGAQDRGEGGRPTQVVLVRRASRSSSASPASSFTHSAIAIALCRWRLDLSPL